MDLVLIIFATFWAWLTFRQVMEEWIPDWFYMSRALQPLMVLALPLYLLWPQWVVAMAAAGAVGFLVLVFDVLSQRVGRPTPVQVSRPTRGGLPPLP